MGYFQLQVTQISITENNLKNNDLGKLGCLIAYSLSYTWISILSASFADEEQ